MTTGQAYKIFHDLDNDQYTLEEKAVAIHTITDMATHNGVKKDAFVKACKWLWNLHFEEGEHELEQDREWFAQSRSTADCNGEKTT